MKNSVVLEKINELIIEECGRKVALDDMFLAADIDEIGLIVFFIALEEEFPIFAKGEDPTTLDLPNLTVRNLVHRCRLSLLEQ